MAQQTSRVLFEKVRGFRWKKHIGSRGNDRSFGHERVRLGREKGAQGLRRAPERSSFRDPDSLVFTAHGVICRQISRSYYAHYDRLMESGLYAKLVRAGLVVAHVEGDPNLALSADPYKVILPDPI